MPTFNSSPRIRQVCLALTIIGMLGLCPGLEAQNPRGALRGEVLDASGARVAAAKVLAESEGSALKSEGETNGRGEFRIEGLLPGAYHVNRYG
jgi:hypothetical protein